MSEQKALRRRIAPFTPLALELEEPGGQIKIEFKLAFTMNAGVALQEKTRAPHRPDGLLLTELGPNGAWAHVKEPLVLRAMTWCAVLAHHPEYDTADDEGILTIGSFIQEKNQDAIGEALFSAYKASLSPAKREFLEKIHREAEEREKEGNTQDPPKNEAGPTPASGSASTGSNSGPSPVAPSASALTSSAS